MTLVSKNVYIDKLKDINNKCNKKSYRTIKTKPADLRSSTYIDFGKGSNDKDTKFKVGDHVRISKYKNISAKSYVPNWSEDVFVIKKIKNTVPWTYVIGDHKVEEIFRTFYEKELQKKQIKTFLDYKKYKLFDVNKIILVLLLLRKLSMKANLKSLSLVLRTEKSPKSGV